MLKRLLCLACLLCSVPVFADAGAAVNASGNTVGGAVTNTSPLTVVLGLAFIVLLIFACAWLMKRLGAVHLGGVSGMKVVAGLSVGPREKVLLIEVGDKQVLIGVATGRVTHLQSFDQPVIDTSLAATSDFSDRLKNFMNPGVRKSGDAP